MSYTSKYTGNEIDDLLDKIKSSDANASKTTLAFLKKSIEGIKANVSFDMDILANIGLDVSENNRIVLKAGKTYIVRYAVEYLGSSSSSNVQLGFATNFEAAEGEDKFTYLYSESLSSTWGNSGEKDIIVIPNEDTELTFITSQHTSSTVGKAWVKCIVEGINIDVNTDIAPDSSPIGSIISFMGTIAPDGYLACNGAELEISKYSKLASHFEKQFGTKNHFGGDGVTTFAVPDLRNEFLRGYYDGKEEQLSGEVGVHQEATLLPNVWSYTNPNNTTRTLTLERIPDTSEHTTTLNADKSILRDVREMVEYKGTAIIQTDSQYLGYPLYNASRPTNVAVLYCIKY